MFLFRILWLVGIFLSLSVLTLAQDNPELDYLYPDYITPIAKFGWGVPYDAVYTPDSQQVAIATGAGVTFYDHNLVEVQYINTQGHSPEVIAISPDGKVLATGSDDVYLWDIATGQNIDILITGYSVSDIAFSADGRLIAVSKSWMSTRDMSGVFIFETASGRLQQHLQLNPNDVFQQIAFGLDSQHLFAIDCCHVGNLLHIDIETLETQPLTNSEGFIVSPDHDKIISFTHGWTILDNVDNPVESSARSSHPSRYARAISPINDEGLFSGVLENGDYGQWDSESLEPIISGTLDFKPQIAALSPDGIWLTALSHDGLIASLNIKTNELTTQTYLYAQPDILALFGDRVFFVTNKLQLAWWNMWTNEYEVYDSYQGNIEKLIIGGQAWIYIVTDDGIIQRLSPFNQTDSITLFEQANTQITSIAVQDEGDLFAVICEYGEGKLLRLDAITGESLGFYPEFDSNEATLPAINLPRCEVDVTISESNDIFYFSGDTVSQFDGIHANSIMKTQLPLFAPKLYMDADPFTLIHESTAFRWSPSSLSLLTSHTYDITAFAQLDSLRLVASSACNDFFAIGNDFYCYGADMAVTNWDKRRSSLIGHSATVRKILLHSYLPIFVSLSEDGTIMVWGSPLEAQAMRREGVFGLQTS